LTPAGTVIVAGTVTAAVLLLDNATRAPPDDAGAVRVTVPDAVAPPCTLAGLTLTESRVAEVVGGGGGGGVTTVQPDSRTFVGTGEPSLTSTVQSAGLVYPDRSILKPPELLLVVICTPSTVIGRLATAEPSIFSLSPLTSARDTLTAACADCARATERTAITVKSAHATRYRRPVMIRLPSPAMLLLDPSHGHLPGWANPMQHAYRTLVVVPALLPPGHPWMPWKYSPPTCCCQVTATRGRAVPLTRSGAPARDADRTA